MSTSGQGDQISGANKDDDPEISSTTSENKGTETVCKSNEISAVVAIDPEDKALEIVVSDLPSSSFDKKPVTDAVIASSIAKIQENSDMTQEGSKLRVDTDCDVGMSKVSPSKALVSEVPPESSFSDVTEEAGILSPKPGILKDNLEQIQPKDDEGSTIEEDFKLRWDEDDEEDGTTKPIHTDNVLEIISSPNTGIMKDNPELIQTKADKDTPIEEDFKLRWDEDDEEDGTTEPIQTDYVLQMLDMELGVDAQEKPDSLKIANEEETIKSVKDTKSDKIEEKNEKDVIKAMTENLVTVDNLVNQLEDKETPQDVVELEKPGIEESKPQTAIKVLLKPLTEDDEVMKVDETGHIIEKDINSSVKSKKTVAEIDRSTQDGEIQKTIAEIDRLTQDGEIQKTIAEIDSSTQDGEIQKTIAEIDRSTQYGEIQKSIAESDRSTQDGEIQKTMAEIDKSTQDGEINKSTKVPAISDKPITSAESDKQLVNVKMPMDEVDSEKPEIETRLKTESASKEIPLKPLIKDADEIDVDDSEAITQKKETAEGNDTLNEAVTVIDSYEESPKTVPVLDSLTQDEIDKTVEPSTVTVDELDKHLEEVEIPKDEFIKCGTLNTEELFTKTVSIEIPFKPLAKDDKEMDVDTSGEKENVKFATTASVSSVDDSSAEFTQDNTMDSVQMKEVKSIKDKEVLDNIEDKQETSNINHDIIAEVLEPAETLTSENDILSADKTIHKEDPKTKGIEDISEIPQPVADKNKESDAINTNKELDDKLSSVQNIDNESIKGQEINDIASSVQGNMKSLDEQNIVHKSSESQAVDDKANTQDIVDEILNVQTIRVPETGENSILDDSFIDTTISPNKHHRINKPDVMLDIPTQDFSDIEAELSDSEMNEIEKSEEFTEKSTKIDENPSESNNISNVTPEKSGVTTATIQIDATTSKLNITTVSPIALNQVPSIDFKIDEKLIKTQDILTKKEDENLAEKSSQEVENPDDKPSSSRQVDDQQPCGSKDIGDDNMQKLSSDDADDVQESDSLGLLAVSSRVMDDEIDDDDEEPEELDHDDNDDDEDFDPYDESSSQMLGDLEDTDESNPPVEKVDETEIIDADEQTDKQTEKQPDKITSILAKVLGLKDLKPPEAMAGNVLTYVELEGSSDSDDVQEISKQEAEDLISVKVPAEVDVMLTAGAEGDTSAMHSNKDEVVISVPKPHPLKVAKINTSEVTIKAATKTLESLQIPETTTLSEKSKDEVFNIDSDDEEEKIEEQPKNEEIDQSPGPLTPPKPRKCINPHCTSTSGVYSKASRATVAYYTLARRSGAVCRECKERATERSQALVDGIKDLRPLLELHMEAPSNQLVEISDSDEDDEPVDDSEQIGEKGAKFLLDNLEDVFSEVWAKYEIDSRLKQTETYLMAELDLIEAGAKELDAMLDECQIKTDAIRTDFYKDYEPKRRHVGGVVIHDTPFSCYSHLEQDVIEPVVETPTTARYPKRRSASNLSDPPAKKPFFSVELLDKDKQSSIEPSKMEEDKDISVVKLSAESAPASLPPQGELVRPALHAGMSVFAMRNAFGTWNKAKILEIVQEGTSTQGFTQCRVKFEHKVKNSCKVLAARCLAYSEPCAVRYAIGTRVVALFKDPQSTRLDAFYAGVVAEVPNPVNNYRYLVFFDDGYAQYIQHADTRLVCQASALVWEEVHPFIHDFVKNYLTCYPERPMVRLKQGETLNTEWNGKWWSSSVLQVDASIALIHFDQDDRTEWIYRGSTRLEPLYLELQAAKAGGRSRLRLPRTKQIRSNMPCVEYTRSEEVAIAKAAETQQRQAEEMHHQRAVAKKSTTDRQSNNQQTVIHGGLNSVTSRVVYYTPKHVVKPERMRAHACNPSCSKRPELLTLKALRTYNPLAKPLLSGWERQMTRYKGHRLILYRAPCGRRLRDMAELHRYLLMVESDLTIDLFDFTPGTHCLAEFMLSKCIVGKKDLSHGKENVPVACVNYYDDSLPEFCSYNTERTPTAGVPLNLDPDFLCGCDCTDDCQDKTKCACWKMTLEGARTIGLEGDNIGYVYRRLPEPLPSGIYECNSRCSCRQSCLNRVAQHPLQLKLQVFKTLNRGWGIRALNDVPKGAFLCVYAGNLLTDATANLDGLNEGDEYLAELDYIEVVEGMKEGYEDDVPESDKAKDQKGEDSESESAPSSESEEDKEKSGKDDDFQPNAYIPQPQGAVHFQKSLRKREKKIKKEEKEKQSKQVAEKRDDCITISDDEEVREPSRFTADGIAAKNEKHSSRVSVRTLFGKDEACYIMDAKVQGNIGRYLNHSCRPNVFVQNVFVDTHDPRFPWVAFFALSHVRAGQELTWNYNYDVGSVPGKVLYCFCGAANCRGRLL